MNNTFNEALTAAYKKYFCDQITFLALVGEINKIHQDNNLKHVFIFTPDRESQFYSNISKSLYKYGGTK